VNIAAVSIFDTEPVNFLSTAYPWFMWEEKLKKVYDKYAGVISCCTSFIQK
jgi:hypothetical protein